MISVEFLITSLIVVLIPGTGVIYTVSTGLVQGRRASIYAALGVPEVWRYAAEKLTFYRLSPDGEYAVVEQSVALNRLPAQVVEDALHQLGARSANEIIREFAQWLREHRLNQ